MGRSYCTIELKTTNPSIVISAPPYVIKYSECPIFIHADCEVSPNHEVYIIDSKGRRYDFTMSLDEDRRGFSGKISFSECSQGMAIIHARVLDDVDNPSPQAVKLINIMKASVLKIDTMVLNRRLDHTCSSRKLVSMVNVGT